MTARTIPGPLGNSEIFPLLFFRWFFPWPWVVSSGDPPLVSRAAGHYGQLSLFGTLPRKLQRPWSPWILSSVPHRPGETEGSAWFPILSAAWDPSDNKEGQVWGSPQLLPSHSFLLSSVWKPFFKKKIIYLFIFACTGSLLLCVGFL